MLCRKTTTIVAARGSHQRAGGSPKAAVAASVGSGTHLEAKAAPRQHALEADGAGKLPRRVQLLLRHALTRYVLSAATYQRLLDAVKG